MPRKNARQKLQDALGEAQSTIRNAEQALSEARNERDKAREALGKFTEAANAHNRQNMAKIRALFGTIFAISIERARSGGYIDRVREIDNKNGISVGSVEAEIDFDRLRDDIATSPERQRDRILDGLDQETFDTVLGRPEQFDPSNG